MLEWLGGHYAEIVGTAALVVTSTNLTITLRRGRREARLSAALQAMAPAPDGRTQGHGAQASPRLDPATEQASG